MVRFFFRLLYCPSTMKISFSRFQSILFLCFPLLFFFCLSFHFFPVIGRSLSGGYVLYLYVAFFTECTKCEQNFQWANYQCQSIAIFLTKTFLLVIHLNGSRMPFFLFYATKKNESQTFRVPSCSICTRFNNEIEVVVDSNESNKIE